MEEAAASSQAEAAALSAAVAAASGVAPLPAGVELPAPNGEQIALMEQIYKQKQLDLLAHFERAQQNLAMQHLQQYYQAVATASLSQAHRTESMDESDSSPVVTAAAPLTMAASLGSLQLHMSTGSAGLGKESGGHHATPPVHRANKSDLRSQSGSQTISQNTKDRLKMMIASRRAGDGSQTNLHNSSGSSSWGTPPSGNAPNSPQVAVSSPHFEPYRVPASLHQQQSAHSHASTAVAAAGGGGGGGGVGGMAAAGGAAGAEFQLRKVNSEPNLKMRIRAKLLSKGNSPVQQQHSVGMGGGGAGVGGAFIPPTLSQQQQQLLGLQALTRVDSNSALAGDGSGCVAGGLDSSGLSAVAAAAAAGAAGAPPPAFAFPPHLIMNSPSLPNLAGAPAVGIQPIQVDMASLLAQANQLTPFLSLPSLLKTQLGVTDNHSILDEQGQDKSRLSATQLGQLPIGGYPSLLKQQLRELVLRRKSLVREEPEDESANEHAAAIARLAEQAAAGVRGGEEGEGKEKKDETGCGTGLAYDSWMARHECVCGESGQHVEHGGRVASIWQRLLDTGLAARCEKVACRKASLEALRAVHSPTYVTFFAVSPTACLKMDASQLPLKSFVQLPCGGIGVDSDTYFNDASTQTASRIAAGSLIELASQVAEGKLRNGFACIRPPGHHAEKDQAMGFCFFNNVAVTVKHLQARYPQQCKKIAIVDWDVHHGNGTQLCFESDPNVLYLSLHRHDSGNFFPGTGAVEDVGAEGAKGTTVNVAFCGGVMRDADYLAAWRTVVRPVLTCFEPDMIVVSAGFDACAGHPNALGGYELSPSMFGHMTRELMQLAGGRVVLALEGGYELTAISDSAEQCVRVLMSCDDDAGRLSMEALESVPSTSAQETICKVMASQLPYWPSLTSQGVSSSEQQWLTMSHQFQNMSV